MKEKEDICLSMDQFNLALELIGLGGAIQEAILAEDDLNPPVSDYSISKDVEEILDALNSVVDDIYNKPVGEKQDDIVFTVRLTATNDNTAQI